MNVRKFSLGLIGVGSLWFGGHLVSAATPPNFYVPWGVVCGSWLIGFVLTYIGFRSWSPKITRHEDPAPVVHAVAAEAATRQTIQHADWTATKGFNPSTNESSERLSADVGRWNIAVNRYDGDNERVQVFIVDKQSDDDFYESLPIDKVGKFICDKTGLSADQIQSMYSIRDR